MTRVWVARLFVLGIAGFLGYAFWRGTPDDVVHAVRSGDVAALKSALRKDAESVHTKSYPQAYGTISARQKYQSQFGRDPWEGRYLVHDAVEVARNPTAVLDVLAAGGADLAVRLKGKTLLHLAAEKGDLEVATWLLDHGADIHAVVDCTGCDERGYTPLHSGLTFRDDEMTALLLSRGARVDTAGANGRTAMHVAADRGLAGALVLARHGADVLRPDAQGKTPYDVALEPAPGATASPDEVKAFAEWFAPRGPFATVSDMVRAKGAPMSDEAAREVIDGLATTPK